MWAFHTLQDIPVSEVYTKPGKIVSSFVISTCFSKFNLPDNNMLLWKCQNKIFQCSEEVFFFSRHECCKNYGLDPWKCLMCRKNKWFARVVFFFFFSFSLDNANLHLCKPEKKSQTNGIMLTSSWCKQEANGSWRVWWNQAVPLSPSE